MKTANEMKKTQATKAKKAKKTKAKNLWAKMFVQV